MRFSSILLLILFCNGSMGEVRNKGWRHFPTCDHLYARFGAAKWVQPTPPNPKDAKLHRRAERTAARDQSMQELESEIYQSGPVEKRKAALVKRFLYGKAYSEATAIALFFNSDTIAPFANTKSYRSIAASIVTGDDATVRNDFEREIKKQLRERRK